MLEALLFFLITYHFYWVAFRLIVHGPSHHHWTLTPIMEYFCRFVLWMTMGLNFPNWLRKAIAQHRIHHRDSDTDKDLLSPHNFTLREFLEGVHKYEEGRPFYVSPSDVEKYGSDIKLYDDWLENNLFLKHRYLGLNILWIIYVLLFGLPGLVIGAIHRFYSMEINIIVSIWFYHNIGYQSKGYNGEDKSKNVFPLGILLAGEELHHNHHRNSQRLNYAMRWFEFDLGYWYARALNAVGLIKIHGLNPNK